MFAAKGGADTARRICSGLNTHEYTRPSMVNGQDVRRYSDPIYDEFAKEMLDDT